MTLPSPLVLGAIYGISEFCLALTRRLPRSALACGSLGRDLGQRLAQYFERCLVPARRAYASARFLSCWSGAFFVRRDFALVLDLVSGPLFYGRCIDRGGTTRHRFRPVPFHPASVLPRRADRIRRIRILSRQLDIDPVCDVADCGRVSVAHPR